MQSRPLKPRKNYPKHTEFAIAPLDPNTSYAHILEMVGERKKVLDVGCGSGYLANLLVKRECDVVGIDANPIAAEEARKYCTSVIVSDLDETVIPELLDGRQFDAIIFADVLEHLHEPARTLDESRALLSERGYVVASIPNVSHGAIRLALLSGRFDYQELGILDDSHLRFFTAKTIDELFLTAGFRIETVDRVTLSLFAESDLVPALDPRDFDEKAVAEVKTDPDSETLQFVVKAFPLSNDQRLRTISKRFLTANTELTAVKQQIAHRESQLEALHSTLRSQETSMNELREESHRAQAELDASRAEFKELEASYRALEIEALAKQNAALERTLLAQSDHARSIETIADLQLKIEEAERSQSARAPMGVDVESLTLLEGERQALQEQVEAERSRAADLAKLVHTMQSGADALREEMAALTKSKTGLEERLQSETARSERLGEDLASQRARATELSRTSQELRAGATVYEERLRAESNLRAQLESEIGAHRKRDAELRAQAAALHSAIESLDAEVAVARLGLSRSRAALQAVADAVQVERQAFAERIERTESDCDELLTEALAVADVLRLQMESHRLGAEMQRREDGATISELEAQLDAIRKAAQADKLVMRQYADDFRQRAERAEKELHGAIRQRDDLYIRVVDGDRTIRESYERNAQLDEQVRQLELRLDEEYARSARIEAEFVHVEARSEAAIAGVMARSEATIAEVTARSEATIAEMTARSEATIAELRARASSLENDVARQQAVLEHLRESSEGERARAASAAADLASLTVRYEILQGNLAEMENQLVAQTEELLASTSDERDRLLTLIDTVQSSHFWRLKHWLARLRTRLFGAIAPARDA